MRYYFKAWLPLTSALLYIYLLCGIGLYPVQAQQLPDTIAQIRALINEGDINKSFQLLSVSHERHPANLEVTWLYAQIAYWSGKFELAESLYQQAITDHPDVADLQLSYAMMLTETGKLSQSAQILRQVVSKHPDHPLAWRIIAQNSYYGANLREASEAVAKAIALDAGNQELRKLRDDIEKSRAAYIKTGIRMMQDDQPIHLYQPELEFGKRISSKLNPVIGFSMPFFTAESQHPSFKRFFIGNDFMWMQHLLQIRLQLGYFSYSNQQEDWTGNILVAKKLSKQVSVTGEWERKPYLATMSSLDTNVMEHTLALRLKWDHPRKWHGELISQLTRFPSDENRIINLAAWIFAPPLNVKKISFSVGYGVGYGNADKSRFTSVHSLSDIIANQLYLSQIQGVYNPYFTPKRQQVHSLLGLVNYEPDPRLSLVATVNYGFYAEAYYPYLYLDRTKKGQIYVAEGFQYTNFNPMELKFAGNYHLRSNITLSGEVRYSTTLFYKSIISNLFLRFNL